jgi:hypothetical protein
MTPLEEILSRALLVRDRAVPRDVVPPSLSAPGNRHAAPDRAEETPNTAAAEELRALCETLVTHTPAAVVTAFVTDELPEPRSALFLACVLQLTDTDDGARFWWQYAAGAGQSAAAYCLYLHHRSLGEEDTARWWHSQTDDVLPPPPTPAPTQWERIDEAPTTTVLDVLRDLAKRTTRPRSAQVTELMEYMPAAVAVGYLREPDIELPLPGPAFASNIRTMLAASAKQSRRPTTLPARKASQPNTQHDAATCAPPPRHRQMDATH